MLPEEKMKRTMPHVICEKHENVRWTGEVKLKTSSTVHITISSSSPIAPPKPGMPGAKPGTPLVWVSDRGCA